MKKEFLENIQKIQFEMNVPKSKFNDFGKFKYRTCEDIMNKLKKVLKELNIPYVPNLTDEIVLVGNRFYVKATASLTDGEDIISSMAVAREAENKKGMDEPQVTGTASTYARKYAWGGLLLLDDSDDPDDPETKIKGNGADDFRKDIANIKNIADLTKYWNEHPTLQNDKDFSDAMSKRKTELLKK